MGVFKKVTLLLSAVYLVPACSSDASPADTSHKNPVTVASEEARATGGLGKLHREEGWLDGVWEIVAVSSAPGVLLADAIDKTDQRWVGRRVRIEPKGIFLAPAADGLVRKGNIIENCPGAAIIQNLEGTSVNEKDEISSIYSQFSLGKLGEGRLYGVQCANLNGEGIQGKHQELSDIELRGLSLLYDVGDGTIVLVWNNGVSLRISLASKLL